jgi:hypothetical protein
MKKVWCTVRSKKLAPGDHELIRLQLHANHKRISKEAFAAWAKKRKRSTGD